MADEERTHTIGGERSTAGRRMGRQYNCVSLCTYVCLCLAWGANMLVYSSVCVCVRVCIFLTTLVREV